MTQLRSQPAAPLPSSLPADTRPVMLLDPGLFFESGHHATFARLLRAECAARSRPVSVFGARRIDHPPAGLTIHARGLPTLIHFIETRANLFRAIRGAPRNAGDGKDDGDRELERSVVQPGYVLGEVLEGAHIHDEEEDGNDERRDDCLGLTGNGARGTAGQAQHIAEEAGLLEFVAEFGVDEQQRAAVRGLRRPDRDLPS